MYLGKVLKIVKRIAGKNHRQDDSPSKPKRRYELDIFFTSNFHARAREWGLTEAHGRYVFYEGDTVKENIKVARYKGQEIGIYVFRDRDTDQPVITSIWKRPVRGVNTRKSRR